MNYCDKCWSVGQNGRPCQCGGRFDVPAACESCDDIGCPECQKPEGFDSIVDRLMARGYDRDEAEERAMGILEEDAA